MNEDRLRLGRKLTADVLAPMKQAFVGKDEIIDLLGVCLVAGTAMLTGVDAATPLAQLLVAYAVFGLGFGFVNAKPSPKTRAPFTSLHRALMRGESRLRTTSPRGRA